MTSLSYSPAAVPTIQAGGEFELDDYQIEVLLYKGQLATQTWYFEVNFWRKDDDSLPQRGLVRVGSADAGSGLAREAAIRTALKSYQMIAPVLAQEKRDVLVVTAPAEALESTPSAVADTENLTVSQTAIEEADTINADILGIGALGDTKVSENEVEAAEDEEISNQEVDEDEIANEIAESDDIATVESAVDLPLAADSSADHRTANLPLNDGSIGKLLEEDPSEDLNSKDSLKVEHSEESPLEENNIEADHLEEEYYDQKDTAADSVSTKLILLSVYPDDSQTLAAWLEETHTQDENLSVLIQVCQFFSYLHQRNWCFAHLLPQFIQLSKPVQFYDLTGAYALDDTLTGLQGPYCAPELSYQKADVKESLSSYVIGALLYQLVYRKPFNPGELSDLALNPIPRISQLLKICLSSVGEDRFPLTQLLAILIGARQALRSGTLTWEVAHRSTVGLSLSRLQNEDSYGVKQQQLNNSQSMMIGIMADGMGGLAEGDVASATAVKTFLDALMPAEMTGDRQQAEWLEELVQKANDAIASTVREGGTTLSAVLAIDKTLTLAHVGDSRIYLLRNRTLCQISEDHSLVAMMVASGEITHQESLEHPDRNMLTKSLGSKRQFADGYIQTMTHWGKPVSMPLEDGDILLLCSDGVWDLAKDVELCEAFVEQNSIQQGVNDIINKVLERGASDNATLLALKLNHDTSRPD